MRFVDTNILLYRVSSDPLEVRKQKIASEILCARDLCLSVQVLQEFYVQSTRASRPDALSHDEACTLIHSWRRYAVLALTLELVEQALMAKERWRLSYWDAAVLEAARASQCAQLLSEDLNDGQDYGGVRVVNPFL
ncbi:MAG: PIN domain-containing protein [Verrucomicrobiota bacterium]